MERGGRSWSEVEMLGVSGSRRFAAAMAAASPFTGVDHAVRCARHIWLNEVDVNGWLEGFAAHPAIGSNSPSISQWCKEEQSAAMASNTDTTAQELLEWNEKYKSKFGFVFLICASGRSTPEILGELKRRFANRPIVELELAAHEELKIIELRLAKLLSSLDSGIPATVPNNPTQAADRIGVIGAHLSAVPKHTATIAPEITAGTVTQRTRPPITTHVLDVARGIPAPGLEVHLEKWNETLKSPSIFHQDSTGWSLLGSSSTNSDGRSGHLLGITDHAAPGFYRISFDTRKYAPSGFFPFVSIVFEIREGQELEHFHVPLLFAPFSFTTYRGS